MMLLRSGKKLVNNNEATSTPSSTSSRGGRGRQQKFVSSTRQSMRSLESSMQSVRPTVQRSKSTTSTANDQPMSTTRTATEGPGTSRSNNSIITPPPAGNKARPTYRTPIARRLIFDSSDENDERQTSTGKKAAARRLIFESDDDSNKQSQMVYDYNYKGDDQCLYRQTPYNQKQKQQQYEARHPTSWAEVSQTRQASHAGDLRTAYENDYDYQPSMMDVDHSVSTKVIKQAKLGAELFTVRPDTDGKQDQYDADDSSDDDEDGAKPRTAKQSVSIHYESVRCPTPHSSPRVRSQSFPPQPSKSTQKKITGISKAPLSFIAEEMGRPTEGPFYTNGPEHKEFIKQRQQQHQVKRTSSLVNSTATTRSNGRSSSSSFQRSTATDADANLQIGGKQQGRHQLEIIGDLQRVAINGELVWWM